MDNNNYILNRKLYCILGLPFDAVDLEITLDEINKAVDLSRPCFLSTPNLNFVMGAQSDKAFFDSVVESNLNVVDGMPLILVAKLLGLPIINRVAGSTVFEQLSTRPREKKMNVFFFGGKEGVAEQAHRQLNKTSQGLSSCGFFDPGFVSVDEMSTNKILKIINNAKPDFIVVALGAKKGQQWIQKNRAQLNAPVISHLGAVMNFVAGVVKRAPISWQRKGLEWLWRIKQEPALWKRYFFDGMGFIRLLLTKVFPLAIYDRVLNLGFSSEILNKVSLENDQTHVVHFSGHFHHEQLDHMKECLASILENCEGDLIFDFAETKYIDSAFIATLLLFQNIFSKQGGALKLDHMPKRIKRIFKFNNVEQRFTFIS